MRVIPTPLIAYDYDTTFRAKYNAGHIGVFGLLEILYIVDGLLDIVCEYE